MNIGRATLDRASDNLVHQSNDGGFIGDVAEPIDVEIATFISHEGRDLLHIRTAFGLRLAVDPPQRLLIKRGS